MSASIGSSLISGIQDISALAAILGTDQCEYHLDSALSRGYIYSSLTPLSLFGSLGPVKVALKYILNPKQYKDAGFNNNGIGGEANGYGKNNNIYKQMLDNVIESTGITNEKYNSKTVKFKYKNHKDEYKNDTKYMYKWHLSNIVLSLFCGIFSLISTIPWMSNQPEWTFCFPIIRGISSAMLAIAIPLIQVNLVYLNNNKYKHIFFSMILLIISFLVILGYIGTYVYVQNMQYNFPIIWLALEIILMLIRLGIWTNNWKFDDGPNIRIELTIKHKGFGIQVIDNLYEEARITKFYELNKHSDILYEKFGICCKTKQNNTFIGISRFNDNMTIMIAQSLILQDKSKIFLISDIKGNRAWCDGKKTSGSDHEIQLFGAEENYNTNIQDWEINDLKKRVETMSKYLHDLYYSRELLNIKYNIYIEDSIENLVNKGPQNIKIEIERYYKNITAETTVSLTNNGTLCIDQ